MIKKYFYVLYKRSTKTSWLTKVLTSSLVLLVGFSMYVLAISLDEMAKPFTSTLFFFFGSVFELVFPLLIQKSEIDFLSTIIPNFDKKKFLFRLIFLYFLIFLIPLLLALLNSRIDVYNFIFLFLGMLVIKVLSKLKLKKTHQFSFKTGNILLKKEISLFTNKPHFLFFLIIYLILLLINISNLELNIFLVIAMGLFYNDSLTLNSVGIEKDILTFLKSERLNISKILSSKFQFHFVFSFCLFILLILGKFFENIVFPPLIVINLITIFTLNFLFTSCLAIRFSEGQGTYYKIKISVVYGEMLVAALYFIFVHYLFNSPFLLLINTLLIALTYLIFQKNLRSFVHK